MTVYVDDMCDYPMGRFRRMKMSHMIADTEDELHVMAQTIGVHRKWYQGDHYDIAKSKRALALGYGAVAITWRQAGAMMAVRRFWNDDLGDPETAVERLVFLHEIL